MKISTYKNPDGGVRGQLAPIPHSHDGERLCDYVIELGSGSVAACQEPADWSTCIARAACWMHLGLVLSLLTRTPQQLHTVRLVLKKRTEMERELTKQQQEREDKQP